SEAALERMIRELDRLEHRKGKVVRLGRSLAWSTIALEVHVDPGRAGTEILVWRRMSLALRIRTTLWMAAGFLLGALVLTIFEEGGMRDDALLPIFLLVMLGGGALLGRRVGHRRHASALPARRAQLEFIADRLVMLASAPDAARDHVAS